MCGTSWLAAAPHWRYAAQVAAERFDLSEWTRRDEAARRASLALVARVRDKTPDLRRILAEHGVAEAYLFGSVADGSARQGSDVDIAVARCPVGNFYRLAARLERALELPLDLVDLDRAPLDMAAQIRGAAQRIYP
jgi:predicted nucleotidyltransferase